MLLDIPEDIEYTILEFMDIKELRPMRLVSKSWAKMIDEIRVEKLKERVYKSRVRIIFHRWTLYTILSINCQRNSNSWVSKKKAEEREILLF